MWLIANENTLELQLGTLIAQTLFNMLGWKQKTHPNPKPFKEIPPLAPQTSCDFFLSIPLFAFCLLPA